MKFVGLFNSLKNKTNEQNNEASAFEQKYTTHRKFCYQFFFQVLSILGSIELRKIKNNWIRFQKTNKHDQELPRSKENVIILKHE